MDQFKWLQRLSVKETSEDQKAKQTNQKKAQSNQTTEHLHSHVQTWTACTGQPSGSLHIFHQAELREISSYFAVDDFWAAAEMYMYKHGIAEPVNQLVIF